METADIEQRIREIAARVAAEHGLELVHAEVGAQGRSAAVRIFIDKPGGVTHEDCSTVSHHVGTVLDVEDFIHSAYTLEVSSPDLNCLRAAARTASFIASMTRSRSMPCSLHSASID